MDDTTEKQLQALNKSGVKLYWTGAGSADMARNGTVTLHDELVKLGFKLPTQRSQASIIGSSGGRSLAISRRSSFDNAGGRSATAPANSTLLEAPNYRLIQCDNLPLWIVLMK
jgi:hypothetical protein